MKTIIKIFLVLFLLTGCTKTDKQITSERKDTVLTITDSIRFDGDRQDSVSTRSNTISFADPVVIIARSGSVLTSDKLTMSLLMYNPFTSVKCAMIKWEISYYAQVLSNPRLESIDQSFSKYKQVIDTSSDVNGNGTAKIYLIATTMEVGDIPPSFTVPFCKVVFDRALNKYPVSYGSRADSFLSSLTIISRMNL